MNQTIGAYLDCLFYLGLGALMLIGTRLLVRSDASPEFARRQKLIRIGGGVLLVVGFVQLALRYFS
jgi:hypothetical protein